MIQKVTLHQSGDSVGVALPMDMIERFGLSAGDVLYAVETAAGILLIPHDLRFANAMEAGDRVTRRYQNALQELAK